MTLYDMPTLSMDVYICILNNAVYLFGREFQVGIGIHSPT